MQRVAEEFLETGNRLDGHRLTSPDRPHHVIGIVPLTIERLGGSGFRDVAAVFETFAPRQLAADTAQC